MQYTGILEALNDFHKSNKIKNRNHLDAKVWIVGKYLRRKYKRRHKKQNK